MKYVIGIDLGTSSVKVLLVDQNGKVKHSVSKDYPLIQRQPGYSEQDPEEWVQKTILALKQLVRNRTCTRMILKESVILDKCTVSYCLMNMAM